VLFCSLSCSSFGWGSLRWLPAPFTHCPYCVHVCVSVHMYTCACVCPALPCFLKSKRSSRLHISCSNPRIHPGCFRRTHEKAGSGQQCGHCERGLTFSSAKLIQCISRPSQTQWWFDLGLLTSSVVWKPVHAPFCFSLSLHYSTSNSG
jgi:hypothetical protein